jgi:hypothetical protein
MRYLTRYLVSIISASAASMGGGACGAIPDMSPARLQEISSHIFTGKVARIYSSVEKSSASPDLETIHGVVELQVKKVEKGKHEGALAYVRFERRRYTGKGPAPGGSYGQRGIPEVGSMTQAFVVIGQDGGYDVLPPNGFVSEPKKK